MGVLIKLAHGMSSKGQGTCVGGKGSWGKNWLSDSKMGLGGYRITQHRGEGEKKKIQKKGGNFA